jgi:transposase
VAGLGRTRLAKSVHDAGWAAFTAMLEYKAKRHGRTFARTGRFEPTSQVCSACGTKWAASLIRRGSDTGHAASPYDDGQMWA